MEPTLLKRELLVTRLSLTVTGVAALLLAWSVWTVMSKAAVEGRPAAAGQAILFGVLAGFLVYGNICYQVARLGYLTRVGRHRAQRVEAETPFGEGRAPGLTVLVPSYKEEIGVIQQTLWSAALQTYPEKRLVLLLDDPPQPKNSEDQTALLAARALPAAIQATLDEPRRLLTEARGQFDMRRSTGSLNLIRECSLLADCYREISGWFSLQAKHCSTGTHTDVWFTEHIFNQPAEECLEQAAQWAQRKKRLAEFDTEKLAAQIEHAYAVLSGRFQVEIEVFERKRYRNLSHEPNKAMNLNSYLGLMGKRVGVVEDSGQPALEETDETGHSRLILNTPYVITLDADSLLLPDYAERLVRLMERPGNERMAVAQTPYSAFPNAPGALERTAGATTDIQYLVHQGFTQYGATFWVGANALLRKKALDEICVEEQAENGIIRRYIQDRTVIEDTESTVDLVTKGWSLFNHPERLAYSATPSDFGSLIIQRGRWANGGLIIFPKLLSFLRRAPKTAATAVQGLLQTHYLTSLAMAPLSVLLLLVIPFSSELMTVWMPLAALPYFALYARDLSLNRYRPGRDLLRVYALNLLLIPIHLGGALKSLQQAFTGGKIPFKRTPKIAGRTSTPALYLLLEYGLILGSLGLAALYGWSGRWISATFAALNAALMLYGVRHFIGFAESAEDIRASWMSWWSRSQNGVSALVLARSLSRPFLDSIESLQRMLPRAFLSRFLMVPLVWWCVALSEVLAPTVVLGGEEAALNLIELENRKSGTTSWMLTKPARHHEIEGYASLTSVNRGGTINLFVHTEAPSYVVTFYRMGWYGGAGARQVAPPQRREGRRQPPPFLDATTGLVECRWEDPIVLQIPIQADDPTDWLSGVYLAKLTAEPTGESSYVLFVVRDDSRASHFLFQSSVTTFQAYNNWGGKSLYDYNSEQGQAVMVSFDRPYAIGREPIDAVTVGAGGFLQGWEYNMVRWLEREGWDVTYATNLDVHRDPALLLSHRAFLSVGHDEYWSDRMRRHVEQARDRGVHLAFFSANTCYWQIRLMPSLSMGVPDRIVVAYKGKAPWQDPVLFDGDPGNDRLATTRWRSAPVNQPEAALLGGMYLEGEEAVDGNLIVVNPSHWMMNGTGLKQGDALPGLLGYEVDGEDAASPPNRVVLTRSPVGSRMATSTLYEAASGALVFNSGSMQWIWGLDDFHVDGRGEHRMHSGLQQMTRNLLRRLGQPVTPVLAQEQSSNGR
ncbi:MAG: N,N-dimethylformamidase beta subunit family domain-containing protein [Nitrospira sp.]